MNSDEDNVGTLGIIGLGNIGGGVLAYLAAEGVDVIGWDIDAAARARAASTGALVAESQKDLIERSSVVFTSLPSETAIRSVYFEEGGLVSRADRIVTCDGSTIRVELAKDIAVRRNAAGGGHVEVGVLGIGTDAAAGRLHLFVAGDDELVGRMDPLLKVAGRGISRFPRPGDAAIAKVLNNGIGIGTMACVADALVLAERAGLDRAQFIYGVLQGHGAGWSVALDRHGHILAEGKDVQEGTAHLVEKDAVALASIIDSLQVKAPFLLKAASDTQSAIATEGCRHQWIALLRHSLRNNGMSG